ncbi:MAG: hypothetical protein ACSHX6_03790 [Akkermansiaceae bacterium]
MSKKIPLTLATASAMMAIPFLGLTSCDSGPVDTGGASSFDLGNRYDEETLTANAGAVVEMPQFLLEGDAFTHDVIVSDLFIGDLTEYGLGFQAGDDPIIVDSAGQISNAEGDSLTPNVDYIYEPDTGSFRLSEQNSFQANLGAEAIRNTFEEKMEEIEAVPFAQIGSLAQAIAGNFTSEEAARIYEVAIESIGLIASDGGTLSFATFGGEIVTDTTVRIFRNITYTPTSTNSTLLETGQISGTVTITDSIINIRVLLPHDGRGRVLALEPSGATSVNGVIVDYSGIITNTVSHFGTFTLDLGQDAF